jgi:membrane-associated phospholipid phosphatase
VSDTIAAVVATSDSPVRPSNPIVTLNARRTIVITLLLMTAGCASLLVDLPVARLLRSSRLSKWFDRPLRYGESFGHAMGAALIIAGIATMDVGRRRYVPRIAAAAFGSGLAANIVKTIVMRLRPHSVPEDVASSLATFGDWFPGPHSPSAWQSFPSAHTAVAVGLAVALIAYYPRGAWLAAAMAALCILHRLATGAHFLSDAWIGAAIGWGMASACLRSSLFDRLESMTWTSSPVAGIESLR